MRIGVSHHLGWANVVMADETHSVVDRRRIELVDPDLPAAPIHHLGGAHEMHNTGEHLDDDELARLVEQVRESAHLFTESALDQFSETAGGSIESISLRDWPGDFPNDIATLRRAPYESQADSIMYREVIAESATQRSWSVHRFDAASVIEEAAALVTADLDELLMKPRKDLGAPWTKEHRTALAATIVAASE